MEGVDGESLGGLAYLELNKAGRTQAQGIAELGVIFVGPEGQQLAPTVRADDVGEGEGLGERGTGMAFMLQGVFSKPCPLAGFLFDPGQ